MRGIKYFVGIAAFAALLAGCAFTSPNGTHVIYNPKGAATVLCITPSGCIGPDGVHYAWHDQVPTAAPAPPPAPPKFKLAAGVWHTFGNAPGSYECHFYRVTASGEVRGEVRSSSGSRFVQTAADDREFFTSGCQDWVQAGGPDDQWHIGATVPPNQNGVPPIKTAAANGDYRIGNFKVWPSEPTYDIQWGLWAIPTACHWQRLRDWSGDPGSVIASGVGGDGIGPFQPSLLIDKDDVGVRLYDCPVGSTLYYY